MPPKRRRADQGSPAPAPPPTLRTPKRQPVVVFAHGAGAPSSSDWMVQYMLMNDISKGTPIELVRKTAKFVHPELTNGQPYQVYVRQLNRARIYGMHENSPTLPSFITLLNVNLENKTIQPSGIYHSVFMIILVKDVIMYIGAE
ncbi:hypothetical protein BAE44_0017426 [Dichanthelium oligosanthes]|uniref:Uncharacterized protein n=1 Tax=Dichanthelium oligosanthes TaxID=888268 RepID=A0A1E5V978_9POAL|nr:hypothetical protein BAE44_0017426 [Dichanthelium oligosanthes]